MYASSEELEVQETTGTQIPFSCLCKSQMEKDGRHLGKDQRRKLKSLGEQGDLQKPGFPSCNEPLAFIRGIKNGGQ